VLFNFELGNQVYAKARVKPTTRANLWLGADVMLEYPLDEATQLLVHPYSNFNKEYSQYITALLKNSMILLPTDALSLLLALPLATASWQRQLAAATLPNCDAADAAGHAAQLLCLLVHSDSKAHQCSAALLAWSGCSWVPRAGNESLLRHHDCRRPMCATAQPTWRHARGTWSS
jgi:Prefoldin subunit